MLTLDAQHRKGFPEVPIVDFKRGKNLEDLLVKAKVLVVKETGVKICGCQRNYCDFNRSSFRCNFLEGKRLLIAKRVVIHIR